jgi:hypothetical protein
MPFDTRLTRSIVRLVVQLQQAVIHRYRHFRRQRLLLPPHILAERGYFRSVSCFISIFPLRSRVLEREREKNPWSVCQS